MVFLSNGMQDPEDASMITAKSLVKILKIGVSTSERLRLSTWWLVSHHRFRKPMCQTLEMFVIIAARYEIGQVTTRQLQCVRMLNDYSSFCRRT